MIEATFKIGIGLLNKTYGKILDDENYQYYWNILKQYSDEDFKLMIENIIKTFIPTSQVPFPLIPHFLQTGKGGKNRAILAVAAVKKSIQNIGPYRSISFGDRALHATIMLFGGWPEMCNWNMEKWEYNEKRFIQTYEAEATLNQGPDKLEGLCELENSQKMHLFNEKQRQFAIEQQKIVELPWSGYQQLLTDKNKTERIERKPGMQSIGELLNNHDGRRAQ